MAICPKCKGTGIQKYRVTEKGVTTKHQMPCMKCHGNTCMTIAKAMEIQKEIEASKAMWCNCKTVIAEDEQYFEDEHGHGWIHIKCGKVTQLG